MLFFQIDVLHLDLHMQSLQSDFSTAIYECTWKKKIKVNTKFVFAVTIKFILLSQPLFILQTCQKMALLTKFCDARNEMNICKLDHSCCYWSQQPFKPQEVSLCTVHARLNIL